MWHIVLVARAAREYGRAKKKSARERGGKALF